MYDFGDFFYINKPFENASFGVIVDIDEDDYLKYHVFLYDEDKRLLNVLWVSETLLADLENKIAVGDKVRMVDGFDGMNLNGDATEAEYGIVNMFDENDTDDLPYNVTFYKHGNKWINYWCAGRQLEKVEE